MPRRALLLLIAAGLTACHHDTTLPPVCPVDGYPAGTARAAGCVPGPGWLAFAFIREGTANPALFISKPDGGCMQRVTADEAYYGGPSYFPGGKRLAYASTRSGTNALYLLDLETGVETPLPAVYQLDAPPAPPTPLIAATPSVSPDGTSIAFEGTISVIGGWTDLFTIPTAGGNALRVTSDPAAATLPRWSPDGARLFYLSYQTGQDLWTVEANGSNPTQVTTRSRLSSKFDVTADGSALVYARSAITDAGIPTGSTELVSYDLGGKTTRIVSSAGEADPAVDPTVTSVAVSRRSGTGYDLYLLDYATGAVKTKLTSCPGQAFGAVFAR
jgi:Tol biopolymer transport system component